MSTKKQLTAAAQKSIDAKKAVTPTPVPEPESTATAEINPEEKKKSKSERKAEKLLKKNLKKVEQEIKEPEKAGRTLKYIYPAEVNTGEKKKEFRRKMRAQNAKYEKDMKVLMDKDDQAQLDILSKEYQNFLTTYYNN